MEKIIRIGTRESQLAVWQAKEVQRLLSQHKYTSELVYIKSDGDIDLVTPLYEIGVQGVFTKALDAALLSDQIDIAVHSMKDVPTQLAKGVVQAAVLERANYKDIFVSRKSANVNFTIHDSHFTIATSSIRRKAQWLHRYPNSTIENLRGNVNTRLKKLNESNWHGAIFAAAGLERIGLRPENSIELDWMLPAPAQGAIMVVCKEEDEFSKTACANFNDGSTALCAKIERDFLRKLLGGCSTPISALATIENDTVYFKGNICSLNGSQKVEIGKTIAVDEAGDIGNIAADEILQKGGSELIKEIQNAGK
ncbi:hydroxymethylbilane synthase [Ferruginibacter albus]|uniref:hydroxymethylbilane synthase n=1 Tax=Ferruginibacter albus TaxID=2875540 RepID=UPI001CC3B78C|nr:hydroxymethylbilane synthase [Ferruginibacter albus]UAY51619.1 hydroxymethylbilane synthase [Ferruginibacter albus]